MLSKNLPAAQEGIDPKTGQLIPLKNIQQAPKLIDELVPEVEAGRKAFRLVIKLTELCDELHQNQVFVSMVVVCPAAKDQQESEVNEVRLKWMTFQLSEFMHDQIVEIVTSRKEIGTLHETYVYVMLPYYLTRLVKSLAIGVSEVSVGAHEFKAWICYG